MSDAAPAAVGDQLPPYYVTAYNSAAASENKIHDDTVARQYGFRGGLVPGVTVFAYMVPPALSFLGREWLAAGKMNARFVQPVYEGDRVESTGQVRRDDAIREVSLELRDSAGNACGTGGASFGEPLSAPSLADFPLADLPDEREPVSEEALRSREILGALEATYDRENVEAYLREIGDEDELWRGEEAPSHPGFLVRWANTILAQNVRLDPWIHVSSDVELHGTLRWGEAFTTRGRVTELFERKGHRFVRLDVLLHAADERPIMRVDHTAIYAIRKNE
ncbi:MAG: hypothetical protein U5Q44_10140 [Dehalococcoidia bacterium]|nr:hypothetical protein [Dehalococcoidia bacterium]